MGPAIAQPPDDVPDRPPRARPGGARAGRPRRSGQLWHRRRRGPLGDPRRDRRALRPVLHRDTGEEAPRGDPGPRARSAMPRSPCSSGSTSPGASACSVCERTSTGSASARRRHPTGAISYSSLDREDASHVHRTTVPGRGVGAHRDRRRARAVTNDVGSTRRRGVRVARCRSDPRRRHRRTRRAGPGGGGLHRRGGVPARLGRTRARTTPSGGSSPSA